MAYDFRANQVRLNKIISSGSIPILIYPSSSAADLNGNVNFSTTNIGSDVFLFVSGNLDGTSKTLFGGNVVTSGSIRSLNGITGSLRYTNNSSTPFIVGGPDMIVNYNASGQWELTGSEASFFTSPSNGVVNTTGSFEATYLSASTGAEITGAFKQGFSVIASGFYSHAQGFATNASSYYAHAEGAVTNASGFYAHSEGWQTNAIGLANHAEGYKATANAQYSHAEGNTSVTYGDYSHAEGYNTATHADNSHTEGYSTSTYGTGSHAEGFSTVTYGDYSHAEGYETVAFGTGSFAAGLGTIASGAIDGTSPPVTNQAAFGKYNLQGNTDSLFVIGDGLDNSNRHDVFRVNSGSVQITGSLEILGGITGSLSGTVAGNPFIVAGSNITTNYNSLGQWEITSSAGGGTNFFTEIDATSIYTTSSVAMPYLSSSTGAQITGSFILTSSTPARIITSIRLGDSSVGANGLYAFGQGTTINAGGDYAFAQGNSAVASGQASHAEGSGTTASGQASHAEGSGTTASGGAAHSEGYQTLASSLAAHSEGNNTTASGGGSHAEGYNTIASRDYAHSEGYSTLASGPNSHAEGYQTTAGTISAGNAHSEGTFTVASGDSSHAEGAYTTASGGAAHSEGYSTKARGNYSHAEGWGSEAYGAGTLAAGLFTVASGSGPTDNPPTTTQASFGKYNLENNTDSLFVVGDGLNASNRHDVFRITSGSVQVTGSFEVSGGITGSLTKLTDGSNYLIASGAVTLTTTSVGAVKVHVFEEFGSYTPVLSFSGGGTPTYASQTGDYYRIGRQVIVNFALALSNLNASTGNISLINLPFTTAISNDGVGAGQVPAFKNINNSNKVSGIFIHIVSNQAVAEMYHVTNPETNAQRLTNNELTNTTQLSGSLYYIAS